jgi:hypothetical protein
MQSERDTESPRQSANANDSWLAKLGPGLVTGAADDDPSGIATYSQAGAQFGYGLLWTLVFTYPLMVGIQLISARIGRVSGHGLATNIRRHYPKWLLYAIVSLLVVANTINIAADISAMADALRLIVGGSTHLYVAHLGTSGLCCNCLRGQGAMGRSPEPDVCAAYLMETGVHHHDRCGFRHHDQSVSVLLASLSGGRGIEGRLTGQAVETRARPSPSEFAAH